METANHLEFRKNLEIISNLAVTDKFSVFLSQINIFLIYVLFFCFEKRFPENQVEIVLSVFVLLETHAWTGSFLLIFDYHDEEYILHILNRATHCVIAHLMSHLLLIFSVITFVHWFRYQSKQCHSHALDVLFCAAWFPFLSFGSALLSRPFFNQKSTLLFPYCFYLASFSGESDYVLVCSSRFSFSVCQYWKRFRFSNQFIFHIFAKETPFAIEWRSVKGHIPTHYTIHLDAINVDARKCILY